MIIGVGCDICNQTRIEKVATKYPERFIPKILTNAEMTQMQSRSDKMAFLAKRFAAKEAIYKAISAHISPPPSWHDAEILNNEAGQPLVTLSERCHNALGKLAGGNDHKIACHLSLSDDAPFVMAVFIVSQSC